MEQFHSLQLGLCDLQTLQNLIDSMMHNMNNMPHVYSIKNTSMLCKLIKHKDGLIISMHGLSGLEIYGIDLNVWCDKLPVGCAHGGFLHVIAGFHELIVEHLRAHTVRSLYLTGYCQGGAGVVLLWHLLPVDLQRLVLAIVTFGQPRVLDATAAAFMDETLINNNTAYIRVVNDHDVITQLPPHGAYRHVGTVFHVVGGCAHLRTSREDDEDALTRNSEAFLMRPDLDRIEKHDINSYSNLNPAHLQLSETVHALSNERNERNEQNERNERERNRQTNRSRLGCLGTKRLNCAKYAKYTKYIAPSIAAVLFIHALT